MYVQDYDETMPRFATTTAEEAVVDPDGFSRGRRRALGFVQPYVKAWEGVYTCPNMPYAMGGPTGACDIYHACAGTSWPNPSNMSLWNGYGWNVDYLNMSKVGCGDAPTGDFASTADQNSGPPVSLAEIKSPAATVMMGGSSLERGTGAFTEANALYPLHGGYYYLFSPGAYTDGRVKCRYSNSGWGQGSLMGPYGGFEQLRHGTQGGNIGFCDGHVKFMSAGALAAGTNWTPTSTNSAITITDLNQYLWDLN